MFDGRPKGKPSQLVVKVMAEENGGIRNDEKYIENKLIDSAADLEEISNNFQLITLIITKKYSL